MLSNAKLSETFTDLFLKAKIWHLQVDLESNGVTFFFLINYLSSYNQLMVHDDIISSLPKQSQNLAQNMKFDYIF